MHDAAWRYLARPAASSCEERGGHGAVTAASLAGGILRNGVTAILAEEASPLVGATAR